MAQGSNPSQRLAEAVRRRRIWLGYEPRRQWPLHKRLSYATIAKIESGRFTNYERSTLIKLDIDMEWPEGSAEAILAGDQRGQPPNSGRSAS